MGKIAFVFSGQGDQHSGMGKDLFDKYEKAREVFEICDMVRPGTSDTCFSGSEDELKETKITQPCLFAMELAAASVLKEKGVKADGVAGFSLGEVVAATHAGIFSNEDGFKLVCKRGELMQAASEKVDSAMAAVLKLSNEKVRELCKAYSDVYPVNFNCPGQVTVSGLAEQIKEFTASVKEAGGRALPLKVKGAFHSPFMKEASEGFKKELEKAEIREKEIEIYSNKTGLPYSGDVVTILSEQISNPVLWEDTIKNMISDGFDTFVEIGPGKTLTNMIKKIDKEVIAKTVYEYLEEIDV